MKTLYLHSELVHNYQAAREIVPLLLRLKPVKSVVDVGCGTGTWLKVFEENGITDYSGLDGDYLDLSLLKIPSSKFFPQDLRMDWTVSRKFEMALCLEVAEHLPESVSDSFVEKLTKLSDIIVFSAAIPGQGGQNHLNEQWPEYWQQKFAAHGFYFHDVIRPLIWNNEKIEWWYRQNIFFVSKVDSDLSVDQRLSIVHPRLFERKMEDNNEFYGSLIGGRQGIKISLKIFIAALLYKLKSFSIR